MKHWNVKQMNPHQALQCFLICSVAYYWKYESLIEDHEYDYLEKYLLKTQDEWKDHQHAYLVEEGNLKAGTMYNIPYKDYPTMILVATDMRLRDQFEVNGSSSGEINPSCLNK